jgi:hypothetical protein
MTTTPEHIKKLFERLIIKDTPNREIIIQYLTEQINDRYGTADELIIIAAGAIPDLVFEPGDVVYVSKNNLWITTMDLEIMAQKNLLLKDQPDFIKGRVISIKGYRATPYKVKFEVYKGEDAMEVVEREVSPQHIYHEKVIPGPGRLNVGDII